MNEKLNGHGRKSPADPDDRTGHERSRLFTGQPDYGTYELVRFSKTGHGRMFENGFRPFLSQYLPVLFRRKESRSYGIDAYVVLRPFLREELGEMVRAGFGDAV